VAVELLVIAKEPVPGRVKTRLCPPCTPREAAALAEAALADTLDAAVGSGADRVVVALDGRPGDWCPAGVTVVGQGNGDLAARLTTAWGHVAGPAVQIGMDTPHVSADELSGAMDTLLRPGVRAVLGPAADGGWWAIGLRRPHPRTFTGIATSRPDTGARQLARLRALGLAPALLPRRRDVDTWTDALAVAAECPAGRFGQAVRHLAPRAA
jgi:glycosyltransferase A (GT-A) superfamily protein (DUF2064 family)